MTMSTLISFLGKGRADLKTGYRIASYRFDAGFARSVPFFGLALTDYLKPDRLVLVGTAGSMWDVFFERRATTTTPCCDLMSAVEAGQVDAGACSTCRACNSLSSSASRSTAC
jgi:CRISPR-associated Csx2 family protein